jgi:hypothetical protein
MLKRPLNSDRNLFLTCSLYQYAGKKSGVLIFFFFIHDVKAVLTFTDGLAEWFFHQNCYVDEDFVKRRISGQIR